MAFLDRHTPALQEEVHLISDPATGLKGAIVIDSTTLGPAAGGCRRWHYETHADLLTDAMRLAAGMTLKNALAGLPLGGGKAVIEAPAAADRRAVFHAFGREVAKLDGRYVTAEDVGTTVRDMEHVRDETRHVAGLPARLGRAGGDPSPWTALGVFTAIEAAVRRMLKAELADVTVAVQGLGNVGREVCRLLSEAGARLIVADPVPERAARMALLYNASPWSAERIHAAPADVFSPCALGASLSASTIPELVARLVCGAANNQLAAADDGDRLADRGIAYAPDFVVNAGGIINVAAEYLGESDADVAARVRGIGRRLDEVFDRAAREGLTPADAAVRMAREIIAAARLKAA